jgi:hypothetical protein
MQAKYLAATAMATVLVASLGFAASGKPNPAAGAAQPTTAEAMAFVA